MASNKQCGIEELISGDDVYRLRGVFDTIQKIEDSGRNARQLHMDVITDGAKVEDLLVVIECALDSKNGKEIANPAAEAKRLFQLEGYDQLWGLARTLLAHAMIGDRKKLELLQMEPTKMQQLIMEPFLLQSSKNRLLLWAYHLLISGICLCVYSSLHVLLFS